MERRVWTSHDYLMKTSEEARKRAKELRKEFKKKYEQERLERFKKMEGIIDEKEINSID